MNISPIHAAPKAFTNRWWYIVALLLFLAGVGGGTAWIVIAVAKTHPPVTIFPNADHLIFNAPAPGRYCLISDVDLLAVREPSPLTGLPEGLTVRVADLQAGRACPVTPSIGLPNEVEGQSVYPLCSFAVMASGPIEIGVTGAPPGCRFMVQRAHSDLLLMALISGSILSVLGWLAGPILAFVVLSRRRMIQRLAYFKTVEMHDHQMRSLFKTSSRN